MAEVKRWCKQCGKYKPLAGFDTVDDGKRRFCGQECYADHLARKKRKRRSYDYISFMYFLVNLASCTIATLFLPPQNFFIMGHSPQ